MIHSSIDHEALFEQVTGRQMRREDADALRRLRAHMPAALADSPSYNFNLVVAYDQMQQLRAVVAGASEAIVDDVEQQSKAAVMRLVGDAVKRIHATSPSSEDAFWRAALSYFLLTVICTSLAAFAILGGISRGWIAPSWLTEESTYKVRWADAVEARIGPGAVDWAMREGKPDQTLLDVLKYIEQRGTPGDPVRQMSESRRCRAPGQVAFRSSGRSMCRFQVVDK